jgi:PilZ domain
MNNQHHRNARSAPRGTRVNSLREITVSYEGNDERIVVKPPNLSTGGMFINTTRSFPEGAVLNLRFGLLLTGEIVETRCEVRYCRPGVGVGVQFIGLSAQAENLIEREIARYQRRTEPKNQRKPRAKRAIRARRRRA